MNREYQKFFNEFFCSRINHVLVPSLQHSTTFNIAIELWNQNNPRESTVSFVRPNWQEWRKIEAKALVKGALLDIPDLLKKELLSMISLINVEIINWWEYHKEQINISTLPNQFAWTPEGVINKKRTAEMLVKNEDLDINTRYKLACIYCLKDQIPELWKQIPEQQKQYFLNKENKDTPRSMRVHKLVKYWTYHLVVGVSELGNMIRRNMKKSHRVYALECAIKEGNVTATEFFFGKLSDVKRNTLLVDYAEMAVRQRMEPSKTKERSSEVFFFLFSRMSNDEQVRLLLKYPYEMLSCFLDRPFQPFFLDLAKRLMPTQSLINYNYVNFMHLFTKKIQNGRNDFNYRQLFFQFWQLCPLSHKSVVIKVKFWSSIIVFHLIENGEKAIVKLILEHADAVDRESCFLSEGMLDEMVRNERWDSLKFFLEVCDPLKNVLVEVKKMMTRHATCTMIRSEEESDAFSQLLDELIAKKSEEKNVEKNIN